MVLRTFAKDIDPNLDHVSQEGDSMSDLSCEEQVDFYMNFAMAREFSDSYEYPLIEAGREAAKKIAADVKQALYDYINLDSNLTYNEKMELIYEILLLDTVIGYPDWVLNDARLTQYYRKLEVHPNYHFFNVWQLNTLTYDSEYAELYGSNATEYRYYATVSMDELLFSHFAIVIPASRLRPPYLYTGSVDAVNFGSFGSLIGSHLIKYLLNSKILLTGNSLQNVYKNYDCFNNMYNLLGIQLDTEYALEHNVADHIGVHIALKALNLTLKDQQSTTVHLFDGDFGGPVKEFFFAFGRTMCETDGISPKSHIPRDARLFTIVVNSPDFNEAFQCSKGTPCTLF